MAPFTATGVHRDVHHATAKYIETPDDFLIPAALAGRHSRRRSLNDRRPRAAGAGLLAGARPSSPDWRISISRSTPAAASRTLDTQGSADRGSAFAGGVLFRLMRPWGTRPWWRAGAGACVRAAVSYAFVASSPTRRAGSRPDRSRSGRGEDELQSCRSRDPGGARIRDLVLAEAIPARTYRNRSDLLRRTIRVAAVPLRSGRRVRRRRPRRASVTGTRWGYRLHQHLRWITAWWYASRSAPRGSPRDRRWLPNQRRKRREDRGTFRREVRITTMPDRRHDFDVPLTVEDDWRSGVQHCQRGFADATRSPRGSDRPRVRMQPRRPHRAGRKGALTRGC
jgi:hypothetical protein